MLHDILVRITPVTAGGFVVIGTATGRSRRAANRRGFPDAVALRRFLRDALGLSEREVQKAIEALLAGHPHTLRHVMLTTDQVREQGVGSV